jgi:hypothetical protein
VGCRGLPCAKNPYTRESKEAKEQQSAEEDDQDKHEGQNTRFQWLVASG